MPRFQKVVVRAGTHVVSDEEGNRHEQTLTKERLEKWAKTYSKLKKKGYNIPAPVDHDTKKGVPTLKIGNRGTPSANDNGGFVESLIVGTDTDEHGNLVPALIAELDIPGDPKNEQSLAFKVGNTIKDTSIYVRPNFLDGTGEVHEEAPMHVGLVVHPIEPGQKNFVPLQKGDLAIAMSQRVTRMANGGNLSQQIGDTDDEENDDDSTPSDSGNATTLVGDSLVAQIIKELRNAEINIDLPEDTNDGNFLDRLLVAARQRNKQPAPPPQQQAPPPPQQPQQGQQPGQPPVSLTKPPRNAVEQPASLAMSQNTPTVDQQLATVMSQLEGYTSANKVLVNYVNALEAEKRANRIAALVASGRITQEYADTHLKPQLKGFQMSLNADGSPASAPVDTLLVALEALPAKTGSVHNTLVNLPTGAFANLPPEAQNAVATVLMSMGGVAPPGSVEEGHPIPKFFENPAAPVDHAKGIEIANQFFKNIQN